MADAWGVVLPGVFALAGVLVGGWVNRRAESDRWRRDWIVGRIHELRGHCAELIEAADSQFVMTSQAVEAAKGRRVSVPQERIDAAGERWSRAFARKTTYAPGNVQDAVVAFDRAREAVIHALDARNEPAVDAALQRLVSAREQLLEEIDTVNVDINDTLTPMLLSRTTRVRQWVAAKREARRLAHADSRPT